MSLKLAVGDLTIHRIIEQETAFLPATDMLPGLTPEVLAENRAWMQAAGARPTQNSMRSTRKCWNGLRSRSRCRRRRNRQQLS